MSKYGVLCRYSITVLQFLKTVFSARNMDFEGFEQENMLQIHRFSFLKTVIL